MRESDALYVALLAFVFAAGCSVPVRPGLDRDVRGLEESFKAASELAESDPRGALSGLNRVESAARELAATFMIGDPRRDVVDKVLAEATGTRTRIEKALGEGPAARMDRALALQAQSAIEDGRESKEEVTGRPPVNMSLVDSAVGTVRRGASAAGIRRDADADFDRPGVSHRRGGDRKGDIDFKKEFAEKERGAPPKPRSRFTQSVTVQRVEPKGRYVVVYLVFLSKGSSSRVASVTGDVLDEKGESVTKIMGAYLAKDFEPNWEDIYDSKGKWITPEGFVTAEADKPLFLAAVSHSPNAKKGKSAKMTIATAAGRSFRGRGP